jgi:hypothetical protein
MGTVIPLRGGICSTNELNPKDTAALEAAAAMIAEMARTGQGDGLIFSITKGERIIMEDAVGGAVRDTQLAQSAVSRLMQRVDWKY